VISTPAGYLKVHGTNLSPEANFPEVVVFLSPSRKIMAKYLKIVITTSYHILSNSSFTNHPTI
jgi:hypothetical protein